MSLIIDGKPIAAALREDIARRVSLLSFKPGLAVILVGDDSASHVYVRNKIVATKKAGMESFEVKLPSSVSRDDIAREIQRLNQDKKVHGILMQLPLPAHLSTVQEDLVQMIAPAKDVDGLTAVSAGKLFLGLEGGFVPCTPQGALLLIQSVEKNLAGMKAVVIGRSNLFGKPMAQLLLRENCTVTTAHSKSRDLTEICRGADILVAAVGRAEMVKGDWIKPGAIVIDVGINRMADGTLCGDVDFAAAQKVARAITPVPGGVGPMTITCLLENTLRAANAGA